LLSLVFGGSKEETGCGNAVRRQQIRPPPGRDAHCTGLIDVGIKINRERAMNARVLPLLCDPTTHESLEFQSDALVNASSGKRYPIREGIPDFLDSVSGSNKKYQELYDRIAVLYDPLFRLYQWFHPKRDMRDSYIGELDIPPGGRVLEVSVGTGANLLYLRDDIEFFGLDLSWGMLRRCCKNLRKWHRTAELFHGEAEQLPFRDEVFDSVFHVGGINFFNDKAAAISEMIRVAKPDTKIVIVDETEKVVSSNYERVPFMKRYFQGRREIVKEPSDLVPTGMRDLRSAEFLDGKLYCLTFRKPAISD
jgi:ubiquinone/menaquinone biosynthesis C-methylase UbiE